MSDAFKVVYTGATDAQVKWGACDDPRGVLVEGETYNIAFTETHSWHTKYTLVEKPGRFNSVCFVPLAATRPTAE